jgi:hypothetical protein
VVDTAVVEDSAAAAVDSVALAAEALAVAALAGLGKMNYKMIFNNKRASNWRLFLLITFLATLHSLQQPIQILLFAFSLL